MYAVLYWMTCTQLVGSCAGVKMDPTTAAVTATVAVTAAAVAIEW
ncbi:hypothetical protein ACYZTR_17350 [Pseudomonas sp. Hz4]